MISTAEFRKGLKIELNGEPYVIVDFQHVKPGKGGAFVRTKLKSLLTGKVLDQTFRSGDKVGIPDVELREMQYLFKAGDDITLMDTASYEQLTFSVDALGSDIQWAKDGTTLGVQIYQGRPIGLELPIFAELAVVKTDPGVRGDTATGGTKPATLETGATVQVPLFLNEGDVVKVDTRTGQYVERASSARGKS